MADVNMGGDDVYDPVQPEENGDYNPESIEYDVQDNESDQDPEYGSDDVSNEGMYGEYVETSPQFVTQQPQSPQASRSPVVPQSPVASRSPNVIRSPSVSRSPLAPKPYDPMESQDASPIAANDPAVFNTTSETFKSSPAGDVNDSSQSTSDAQQGQPTLPKSVDLQALLAGLVPAKSKVASSSPPQARENHAPQPPQSASLPSGAASALPVNLSSDILYQLQKLTSPPPQSTPNFQPPTQAQVPPPQQAGPVDIQPQDLLLTPEEEQLYEIFLENEREVVASARWEQFPAGSRMFIGNLPSDRIGKKDIFRLFYPFGRLAQISIKQAYGFVQFYEKADCDNAIRTQQGMIITGRKVHLEVSKPQKNKDGDGGRGRQQRNRSPIGRDRSPAGGKGKGRARGRSGYDEFDRGRPDSRDFSPPRGYRRDDDYGRRYTRSRSRSPPPARYPGSPRRPHEAPEVAILIKDDPDRGYIRHVEDVFENRRLRTDTIFVSPRASISDLTRQLVLDGVLAIVTLSIPLQERRKVSLQTFQRNTTDPGAVKWDEYNEIEILGAVELVANVKRAPPQPQASYPGYPPQPFAAQQPQAPPAGVNPNLANIIGGMDPVTLQKLMGAIAQQAPAPTTYTGYNQAAAAPLLGQTGLQGFGGQRPAQPTQQVQDIMAQLAALSKKGAP